MEICHVHNLYVMTKIRVASARQACKCGKKDEARDTLRFIRNASIIEIIKSTPTENYPGLEMNWPLLEWELGQLEQECHPATEPVLTNDLARIEKHLSFIAAHIGKALSK